MKYEYLFPYEKVKNNSEIVIYGAGKLGQEYYSQIQITKYCEIVAFLDKNYLEFEGSRIPVLSPDEIENLSFDYVVLAIRIPIAFNEIKNNLIKHGVPEDKIVVVYQRKCEPKQLIKSDFTKLECLVDNTDRSIIAINIVGGYGDCVIQKRLVNEIVKHIPLCQIDIYCIRYVDFIKGLYSDIINVKNVIHDACGRYERYKGEYLLALTVEACHYISVDTLNEKELYDYDASFCKKMMLLQEKTKLEGESLDTPVFLSLARRLFKGYNAYSGFNYDGVFDIDDKYVSIPLQIDAETRYNELLKQWGNIDYITINCGNGECSDNSLVAKTWPLENYELFVKLIKDKYPSVFIVQVSGKGTNIIYGCDDYVIGEDMSVVQYILADSSLHIDVEGGLVHIASQLGTKCIVLFGPTCKEYYGYDSNINISAGNCHNCWGLYLDINKCARGLRNPECMYSITPQMVYSYARQFIDKHMIKKTELYDKWSD